MGDRRLAGPGKHGVGRRKILQVERSRISAATRPCTPAGAGAAPQRAAAAGAPAVLEYTLQNTSTSPRCRWLQLKSTR